MYILLIYNLTNFYSRTITLGIQHFSPDILAEFGEQSKAHDYIGHNLGINQNLRTIESGSVKPAEEEDLAGLKDKA